MRITILNLSPNNSFLRIIYIRSKSQIEKLLGYCGEHLYVKAEREPDDPIKLLTTVEDVVNSHYNTDFSDAAIILFQTIHATVNGKVNGDGHEKTWTISNLKREHN